MKRQTPIQTQKETMLPQMRGLLSHASVRTTSDHDMPSNVSAETRFGHDFSRVAVRPSAPIVSQDYSNASYPMFSQRYPFGGACHTCPPRVQTKLKVGRPSDKYEQEADRVADEVIRMPEPKASKGNEVNKHHRDIPVVQKTLTNSEGGSVDVPPIVHQLLRSSGQPLDSGTRAFMESRFGHDFSQVRVHADAKAAESARSVNALAYTVGRNIVFGYGNYVPQTVTGKQLVAHELTHVTQQQAGAEPNHPGFPQTSCYLQRTCGPAAIGDVGGCIGRGGDITDYGGSSDRIFLFDVNCDDFRSGEESRLRMFARTISLTDVVEIDGFASEEGDPVFNENLSCARALAAESILNQEAVSATMGLFKHGATPGFRDDRRSVVITITPSTPSASTPAPQYICGPDVTTQIENAVSNTKSTFAGWNTTQKNDACQALISFSTGGYAWDILDLHNNAWILSYRPVCATRGAHPPCGSTVEVNAECSYAGSPNYVIYGIMMKLCHSHYIAEGRTSDADDFTKSEMLDWINFYKGTGPFGLGTPSGNFVLSQNWASAGYDGWPATATPSGDRNNCDPSCRTTYSGSAFRVRWVPNGTF